MSARRSAGASFTPSPVIATTWPSARSASAMRSFASGEAPGEHDLPPSRRSSSSSGSLIASSSAPVTTCSPSRPMPTRRATSAAVGAVVAGDDDDADAGVVAARDGVGDLRPGRVEEDDERRGRQRLALGVLAAVRRLAVGRRRRATASTRSPCDAYRVDRGEDRRAVLAASSGRSSSRRPGCVSQRARTSSGAPFTFRRRRRRPRSSTVDMSRSVGSKRYRCRRRTGSGRRRRRRARDGLEHARSPSPRRGTRRSADPRWRCSRPRSCSASRARRVPRELAGRRRRARGRARRRASRSATGCIRFSVSVPVLSVQITVVEPSVSTAQSRLTRAPRRASWRTPTASASVIVGRRPSGTFATIRPIANVSASSSGSPATSQPSGRNARPTASGDDRDQPGDAPHLRSRAGSASARRAARARRSGRARSASRSRRRARGPRRSTQAVPLKTRFGRLERAAAPRSASPAARRPAATRP